MESGAALHEEREKYSVKHHRQHLVTHFRSISKGSTRYQKSNSAESSTVLTLKLPPLPDLCVY